MPERGEIWQVDFGITQKVRPALVISIPYADSDRALIGVIPHTTARFIHLAAKRAQASRRLAVESSG